MSNQSGSSTAAEPDQPDVAPAAPEQPAPGAPEQPAPASSVAAEHPAPAAPSSPERPASTSAEAAEQPGHASPSAPERPASTATEAKQPAPAPDGAAAPTPDEAGRPAYVPGALVLALVAVGWLTAMLWSTREAINSAAAGVTAISLSAYALPGVITAALVAGAAVALSATNPLRRTTLRFLAAVGTGLLVGLAAAVATNLTYADNATTNTIAGTTIAAAIIGGAMAGARNARVVGGLATATLAAQVFVVLFSRARDPLSGLFGAGDTQQSMLDAAKWVSRTESLLAGLIAGMVAFGYLTWARRRAARRNGSAADGSRTRRGVGPALVRHGAEPGGAEAELSPPAELESSALRWPAYLIAGAGPGLLLLLTEVIIRVGGRGLLDLAAALSEADQVAQTALGTSRIDNGIWVLFVGALTALVAFGRTLGPRPVLEEDEPAEEAAA
ncbi:hypothetical protein [Micromonospora sp. NPDC093277]|uniref:hypothetical protein n=1 Tax=Micromonospora sp. NPDC093277 TaxID=3364291 RepID=UPI003828B792